MILLFWSSLALLFYTYFGYGICLYLWIKFFQKEEPHNPGFQDQDKLPPLTLLIAAYNEADFLEEKIENCLKLQYPRSKWQICFVTDGSTDESRKILAKYPEIRVFHQDERNGKLDAIARVLPEIDTPITILCDANTLLNPGALLQLADHFADPRVGAVAGEKKIRVNKHDDATAGEGIYWKYESVLKAWDARLHSVVGAAGELFAFRTALYENLPPDTLIEDFVQSMKIAQKGHRVAYEPEAYAEEYASASIQDELKRKIRISAGGIQAIVRLSALLNPFRYGILSFQYFSHRVLRWSLAPLALPLCFFSTLFLAPGSDFFQVILFGQVLFYTSALLGYLLETWKIRWKILFIPFYFCMMNYAVYVGFIRYIQGKQGVKWEKAARRREIKEQR